jgi:hypothetical protein
MRAIAGFEPFNTFGEKGFFPAFLKNGIQGSFAH